MNKALTMNDLEEVFTFAKQRQYYVAVMINIDGYDSHEVNINSYENIDRKLAYYKITYNHDLTHKFAKGIKIVDITYGENFDEIQRDFRL